MRLAVVARDGTDANLAYVGQGGLVLMCSHG